MLSIVPLLFLLSSSAFAQDSFQATCGDAQTPDLCFLLGDAGEAGTALITVDRATGALCESDPFELPARSVHGISVEGEDAYVCAEGELYRIAMDNPGVEPVGVPCAAVVASADGAAYDDTMDALVLFDDVASLLAGEEPIASGPTPPHSTRYTFDGTTLYTAWHVGPQVGLYTWDASENLGQLELEGFDGWVWGISATRTDLLVLTDGRGESGPALLGFDPETGARRSSTPLSLPGIYGYYGLWCTGA
jgi:hypothetical protein